MDRESTIKRQSTFPLFSKYFGTHPQNVVDFFQTMRRQMEDFIEAFRKRIQIQISYSKNLQSVSKILDKYIKPGTELSTSFICSAFKIEHEQRSRQALQLAQSLKVQIEAMCSEYLKSQTILLKQMQKDIKKLYKEAENCTNRHESALDNYQNISKQMQQTIITKNIMRYTTGIPQQKKIKLIAKASESIRSNKQCEKVYLNAVKQYNTFATAYNKEITIQLNQTQQLIRDQIKMQGNCIRKLIVAEVGMFKNIQYDILNICKQIEHLDTQKDVQVFTYEQKNSPNNRIVPDYLREKDERIKMDNSAVGLEISNSIVLEQKKIVGNSMLSQSICFAEESYFSWMLSNKRNKKLQQLTNKIWRMLKHNENRQQLNKSEKNQSSERKEIQKIDIKVEQLVKPLQKLSNQKTQASLRKQQKPWDQELKQTIATLKIMKPPSQLSTNQKKDKAPNSQKIYSSFMQITSTIALLWNSQQIDLQTLSNKLNTLEIYLQEHHLYRLIALMFIEEYRLQHEVLIKSFEHAKICGKVIRCVLKESQKKSDVFIIRGILDLIFTYYWSEEKVKKNIYIIPQIYQCEIWKKTDFWEAAIFETTFEEMSSMTVQKGQTQLQANLRQKNIIFSQLASYCHSMVMLGVTSKNVRMTVGRYCRLYEMTEEQNKDLSKMINDAIKKYKQTSHQLPGKELQKEKSVAGD